MNTQSKFTALDKTRFGVLSTVVTAFGTQLWILATGTRQTLPTNGSAAAPSVPSSPAPADGQVLTDQAMMKPSTHQRVAIDAHRGDWP